MSDQNRLKRILLAVAGRATLFRNNTGQGWVGKTIHITRPKTIGVFSGDVVIRQARPLNAGLVKGGSDLIGWTPYVIRAADVGRTVALFTALEEKADGAARRTQEQKNFIGAVMQAGGIAGIVTNPEEAVALIAKAQTKEMENV